MSKEAMKQALEALVKEHIKDGAPEYLYKAIKALEEALAKQEQDEPVGQISELNGCPIVLWDKSLPIGTKFFANQQPKLKAEPVGKIVDCDLLGNPIVHFYEKGFLINELLYTTPQQRKPQFKEFVEWANGAGYDTAHAHDGVKWICLNPMTAELWKAWQAANGIKGEV